MIEAVYTLTEKEFAEGQKIWCPQQVKKVPGYWVMQVIYIAFCLCLGLSLHYLPLVLNLGLFGTFAAWMIAAQWRKRKARNYQYQLLQTGLKEASIRLDEIGYHDESTTCGGWIAWSAFNGWRETETIFVLGRALNFITLPKRAFSEAQHTELREMFRTHIRPKQ